VSDTLDNTTPEEKRATTDTVTPHIPGKVNIKLMKALARGKAMTVSASPKPMYLKRVEP